MNTDDFKKEFDALLKKHKPKAILVVVGFSLKNDDMAALVMSNGSTAYLGHTLGEAALHEKEADEVLSHAVEEYNSGYEMKN